MCTWQNNKLYPFCTNSTFGGKNALQANEAQETCRKQWEGGGVQGGGLPNHMCAISCAIVIGTVYSCPTLGSLARTAALEESEALVGVPLGAMRSASLKVMMPQFSMAPAHAGMA